MGRCRDGLSKGKEGAGLCFSGDMGGGKKVLVAVRKREGRGKNLLPGQLMIIDL